jgi:hypothetical protein
MTITWFYGNEEWMFKLFPRHGCYSQFFKSSSHGEIVGSSVIIEEIFGRCKAGQGLHLTETESKTLDLLVRDWNGSAEWQSSPRPTFRCHEALWSSTKGRSRKKSEIWLQKATLGRHLGPPPDQGHHVDFNFLPKTHVKNEIFACLVLGLVNTAYVRGFLIFGLKFSPWQLHIYLFSLPAPQKATYQTRFMFIDFLIPKSHFSGKKIPNFRTTLWWSFTGCCEPPLCVNSRDCAFYRRRGKRVT